MILWRVFKRFAPDIFGGVVAIAACAGLVAGLRNLSAVSTPLFIVACLTVVGLSVLLALFLDGRHR
jgi:hypothetical protein